MSCKFWWARSVFPNLLHNEERINNIHRIMQNQKSNCVLVKSNFVNRIRLNLGNLMGKSWYTFVLNVGHFQGDLLEVPLNSLQRALFKLKSTRCGLSPPKGHKQLPNWSDQVKCNFYLVFTETSYNSGLKHY